MPSKLYYPLFHRKPLSGDLVRLFLIPGYIVKQGKVVDFELLIQVVCSTYFEFIYLFAGPI
jgi:hypothetical protein